MLTDAHGWASQQLPLVIGYKLTESFLSTSSCLQTSSRWMSSNTMRMHAMATLQDMTFCLLMLEAPDHTELLEDIHGIASTHAQQDVMPGTQHVPGNDHVLSRVAACIGASKAVMGCYRWWVGAGCRLHCRPQQTTLQRPHHPLPHQVCHNAALVVKGYR